MRWNPFSDWLPLDNAVALVHYWETDLQYAEQWLKVMETMKPNNKAPGFLKQYNLAVKDVEHSKKELAKARLKLEESKKLE